MEAKARIEEDLMPQRNCDAKDEMNPRGRCAYSAHRLNPEVKTLRFEDRIWDKGRNRFIVRRLTITGSDVYVLPREKDDEVLLGLDSVDPCPRVCRSQSPVHTERVDSSSRLAQ